MAQVWHPPTADRFYTVPRWDEEDFVPGGVQTARLFWSDVILKNHPRRELLLTWVTGVSLAEFADPTARGVFQGHPLNGANLKLVELPNHVTEKYEPWGDEEIAMLELKGCIVRWSEVADTSPWPRICLPLGVEPKKPRLFWDGSWLNLISRNTCTGSLIITEF